MKPQIADRTTDLISSLHSSSWNDNSQHSPAYKKLEIPSKIVIVILSCRLGAFVSSFLGQSVSLYVKIEMFTKIEN